LVLAMLAKLSESLALVATGLRGLLALWVFMESVCRVSLERPEFWVRALPLVTQLLFLGNSPASATYVAAGSCSSKEST
jgi:hypothetical protein